MACNAPSRPAPKVTVFFFFKRTNCSPPHKCSVCACHCTLSLGSWASFWVIFFPHHMSNHSHSSSCSSKPLHATTHSFQTVDHPHPFSSRRRHHHIPLHQPNYAAFTSPPVPHSISSWLHCAATLHGRIPGCSLRPFDRHGD